MPALLSLLRVDDIAAVAASSSTTTTTTSPQQQQQQQPPPMIGGGGMDWGVVAVYSCAASCQQGTTEWVAVQPPVGEEEEEKGK